MNAPLSALISTNICSIQDFLFLNPACSWQSITSTAAVMLCCMMRMNTLLVRKRSVIPRHLDYSWLQSPRSPFLGSLIDDDSFLLSHLRYPLYRIYLRVYAAICMVFLLLLLSESWDIHHLLGLYLFWFMNCIFHLFSVMGPISISRSVSESSISESMDRSGRFRIFITCSVGSDRDHILVLLWSSTRFH